MQIPHPAGVQQPVGGAAVVVLVSAEFDGLTVALASGTVAASERAEIAEKRSVFIGFAFSKTAVGCNGSSKRHRKLLQVIIKFHYRLYIF
ncbi:MAG: hypothetical protein CMK07_05470 [Ponticaulis sp.]|nr:hypothetical protein [Ponticaulis sp.]